MAFGAIAGLGLAIGGAVMGGLAARERERATDRALRDIREANEAYYDARLTDATTRAGSLADAAAAHSASQEAFLQRQASPDRTAAGEAMRQEFVQRIGGGLNAAPQLRETPYQRGGVLGQDLADAQAASGAQLADLRTQALAVPGLQSGLQGFDIASRTQALGDQGAVQEQQRLLGAQYDVAQAEAALAHQARMNELQTRLGQAPNAGAGLAFGGALANLAGTGLMAYGASQGAPQQQQTGFHGLPAGVQGPAQGPLAPGYTPPTLQFTGF